MGEFWVVIGWDTLNWLCSGSIVCISNLQPQDINPDHVRFAFLARRAKKVILPIKGVLSLFEKANFHHYLQEL
jgi:hypothetical protein